MPVRAEVVAGFEKELRSFGAWGGVDHGELGFKVDGAGELALEEDLGVAVFVGDEVGQDSLVAEHGLADVGGELVGFSGLGV